MRSAGRTAAIPVVLIAGLVTGLGSNARAEILEINAEISASVQEFIDGEATSSDSAFEEFGITTAELPVSVTALLGDPVEQQRLGLALADFLDPTRETGGPNPEEFGLEVNCFSLDPAASYEVTDDVKETRTVQLSSDELLGTTQDVAVVLSNVFLSGAVVVWSLEESPDLTGLQAEVEFTVVQRPVSTNGQTDQGTNGASDEEEPPPGEEVFATQLVLLGQPDGEVVLEGTGPLEGVLGGLDLLFDGAVDLSDEELVGQIVDLTVETLGEFHVLLIPDQVLGYLYEASPNEPFVLEARFHVRVVNLPDGTGVAAAFGRPFSGLQEVLDGTSGQNSGASVQSAVNAAQVLAQPTTAVTPAGASAGRSTGLCGALGFEALALTTLGLGLRLLPRRRRWG
jgi:hypothetical protein